MVLPHFKPVSLDWTSFEREQPGATRFSLEDLFGRGVIVEWLLLLALGSIIEYPNYSGLRKTRGRSVITHCDRLSPVPFIS